MSHHPGFRLSGSDLVPARIKAGILHYWREQIPTGSFLRAVLENDLRGAFQRADLECRQNLFWICCYLWNEVPAACWGSPQKVKDWLEMPKAEHQDLLDAWDAGHATEKGS